MSTPVRWVSAFLDVTPDVLDAEVAFWSTVTGSELGAPFGDHSEFLPMASPGGDPCLWLQRIDEGAAGCHVDLYVDDVTVVADHAIGLGATQTSVGEGLVVLRSPGLLPFCLVAYRGQSVRPEPVGPPGAQAVVDQVCLDIPERRYDDECEFWATLTGWTHRPAEGDDEFSRLVRPAQIPYAFLLQRLDDDQPAVTAHLDLACEDRDAVVARHEECGADVVRRTTEWTVLRDPAGIAYCATTRRPEEV